MDNLNEEEIKVTKSAELTEKFLLDSLIPLITEIERKITKLAPLFVSTELNYFVNGSRGTSVFGEESVECYSSYKSLIEDLSITWGNTKDINKFNFEIRLEGLKKAGKKFVNQYYNLEINFSKWKYSIVNHDQPQKLLLEKLYHQKLDTNDINQISKEVFDYIFEKIEKYIEGLEFDNL